MEPLLITIIVLALVFDYINGFHDAANAIATIVSTKVLTPFQAVLWAAVFNFVAFFIFTDHAVANTISKTVHPEFITLPVILAGLLAAITWNLLTCAAIRPTRASLPVLMLSMYPEEQYALLAIQHGANGYVAKDAEPGELVIAIRQVAAGNTYLSAGAAYHIAAQMNGQDDRAAHQRLSMREYQIFLMLIKGRSLTDIGEEMMISIKTVSTHKSHILDKLGVATIADLVRYGVRHGLID